MEKKELRVMVPIEVFSVWSHFLEQKSDISVRPPDIKLVNVTFCSWIFLAAIMEQDQYLGDNKTK